MRPITSTKPLDRPPAPPTNQRLPSGPVVTWKIPCTPETRYTEIAAEDTAGRLGWPQPGTKEVEVAAQAERAGSRRIAMTKEGRRRKASPKPMGADATRKVFVTMCLIYEC